MSKPQVVCDTAKVPLGRPARPVSRSGSPALPVTPPPAVLAPAITEKCDADSGVDADPGVDDELLESTMAKPFRIMKRVKYTHSSDDDDDSYVDEDMDDRGDPDDEDYTPSDEPEPDSDEDTW